MRKLLLAAFLVFGCTGAAQAVDGNYLHGVCANFQRTTSDIRIAGDTRWCAAYIIGVFDAERADYEIEVAKHKLGKSDDPYYCVDVPREVQYGQVVDIVRTYLRDHPKQLYLTAEHLVTIALKQAWPCPE